MPYKVASLGSKLSKETCVNTPGSKSDGNNIYLNSIVNHVILQSHKFIITDALTKSVETTYQLCTFVELIDGLAVHNKQRNYIPPLFTTQNKI